MAFRRSNDDHPARMRDDQARGNFPPRQMIQGSWKCADCGTEITELPFEPAADRPIYCRECWSKKRPKRF